MKVRAKMPVNGSDMCGVGYYDLTLFRGGEEFVLSDPKHFSEKWMEKVEASEPQADGEAANDAPVSKKRRSA